MSLLTGLMYGPVVLLGLVFVKGVKHVSNVLELWMTRSFGVFILT